MIPHCRSFPKAMVQAHAIRGTAIPTFAVNRFRFLHLHVQYPWPWPSDLRHRQTNTNTLLHYLVPAHRFIFTDKVEALFYLRHTISIKASGEGSSSRMSPHIIPAPRIDGIRYCAPYLLHVVMAFVLVSLSNTAAWILSASPSGISLRVSALRGFFLLSMHMRIPILMIYNKSACFRVASRFSLVI